MRLSEAIRLGAMLKSQGFNGDDVVHSCALRAAADAIGLADFKQGRRRILDYAQLRCVFPILNEQRICPVLPHYSDDMLAVIWHLNDDHRWTRERIADWVETVEPADVLTERSEGSHSGRRGSTDCGVITG